MCVGKFSLWDLWGCQLHFASCLSICSDFPNVLRIHADLFLEKILWFPCDRRKWSCSAPAKVPAALCSSSHCHNYGHVTPILRLFVDFSWISFFTENVWGLRWQRLPRRVRICYQKCLFWVCCRVWDLVPSQELHSCFNKRLQFCLQDVIFASVLHTYQISKFTTISWVYWSH